MDSDTAGADAEHHYIDLRIMVLFVFLFRLVKEIYYIFVVANFLATVIRRNLNGFDYNAKIFSGLGQARLGVRFLICVNITT